MAGTSLSVFLHSLSYPPFVLCKEEWLGRIASHPPMTLETRWMWRLRRRQRQLVAFVTSRHAGQSALSGFLSGTTG